MKKINFLIQFRMLILFLVLGWLCSISKAKQVPLGGRLELSCGFRNYRNILYAVWQRPNSTGSFVDLIETGAYEGIVTISKNTETKKLQTRLSGHVGPSSLDMILNNVQCDDENQYRCQVVGAYRARRGPVDFDEITSVTVTVPPQKPQKPSSIAIVPNKETVEANTSLEFTCNVDIGRPAPVGNDAVVWMLYRQGVPKPRPLSATTKVTPFGATCKYMALSKTSHSFTPQDNGAVVKCMVKSNTTLYSETKKINVMYAVQPVSIFQVPFKTIYYEGEQLTLYCITTGNPISYKWMHNGTLILFGDSHLVIYRIKLENTGVYTCEASNTIKGIRHSEQENFNLNVVPWAFRFNTSLTYLTTVAQKKEQNISVPLAFELTTTSTYLTTNIALEKQENKQNISDTQTPYSHCISTNVSTKADRNEQQQRAVFTLGFAITIGIAAFLLFVLCLCVMYMWKLRLKQAKLKAITTNDNIAYKVNDYDELQLYTNK